MNAKKGEGERGCHKRERKFEILNQFQIRGSSWPSIFFSPTITIRQHRKAVYTQTPWVSVNNKGQQRC